MLRWMDISSDYKRALGCWSIRAADSQMATRLEVGVCSTCSTYCAVLRLSEARQRPAELEQGSVALTEGVKLQSALAPRAEELLGEIILIQLLDHDSPVLSHSDTVADHESCKLLSVDEDNPVLDGTDVVSGGG